MMAEMADLSKKNDQAEGFTASAGRILFVDDEENILRALKRLFLHENYDVLTASSGAEALNLLETEKRIGLIVSDQRMPKMTGVEFLERSKRVAPEALRILLTGYADVGAAVDAINLGGASRYVSKPWRDDELLQIVRDCMQQYFLLQENRRLHEIIRQKNEELRRWNDELQIYVQEQTIELQNNYAELKKLNVRLRANFKDFVEAFSSLLEMRDPEMRSHARNVAKLSGMVAKKMGMEGDEVEKVVIAALLHDIGKIGIPEVLLRVAPEELDEEGRREYELHPARGEEVVGIIGDLRPHGLIIRHHHERFDGKGFPDGMRGEEIPLAARIIAIADFVDKKVRNYEGNSGVGLVLEELRAAGGILFDLQLIPHFERPVISFYEKISPRTDFVELAVQPGELKSGMLLGRDVFSATGLLLLSKGTELNMANIGLLKRYYDLDPRKRPISVWSKR